MAASGRALAAGAAARAPTRVYRAACCSVTPARHERAGRAARRPIMVKQARSVRSMLPMSCSPPSPAAQRCSLRARRTRALVSLTGDPCEPRRGPSGRAPPGTAADVAASTCRRFATRRRCFARRESPRRRQGGCLQRLAQETGGACRGGWRTVAERASPRRPADGPRPGRPRAFTPRMRAAGRQHGVDGGAEVRGAQRARSHAANELLSLPQAGRMEGGRAARLRLAARCATCAQVLRRCTARWRCARCSATAVRAVQGTHAQGVLSGCAAAARSALTDAQHVLRYGTQGVTSVAHRVMTHDTLLGCAVRLRAAGSDSDGCCGCAPSLTGLPCATKARS